jgi:predicted RNA binding protein YcfA (HicA-like mRNA interferase family)
MPKLRRLNAKEVISILETFDFEIYSQSGSHIKLRRFVKGAKQVLVVAKHGAKSIPTGTLRSIYRRAVIYVGEDELYPYFYVE